jgi:hypothetical protein
MIRATTPDHAAPALDIKLNQNPNAYFFPASTISGSVIYKNHHGNADYGLHLIFSGSNRVALENATGPITAKATLFDYTINLHTARKGSNHSLANSQVDIAPIPYVFKHRFPSATDNRSFSLAGNTTINTAFSNHVHDLPPSFGAHSYDFRCSVEYSLRAELYFDNCLLTHYTVPVMFLPYMRPVHGTRNSPTFFSTPDPYADKVLGKMRKDSLVSHYSETTLSMGVELPNEITMGLPFLFEVQIQLPFTPEYDDEIPQVKVITLKMLSAAHFRIVRGTTTDIATTDEQQFQNSKSILLHPANTASPPAFDAATNSICYTFQATLSSYYAPSFRSFLVSNSFRFEGPLLVTMDGRKLELPLSTNEVTVLSPVSQPTGMRKGSTMTTSNNRLTYGRT